jgi:L-ornithine Nalpha-acyltransferase
MTSQGDTGVVGGDGQAYLPVLPVTRSVKRDPMVQNRNSHSGMGQSLIGSTAIAASTLAASPYIHRAGQLDVRLATSEEEIAAAQALRYEIFYDEMGAQPDPKMVAQRRDQDDYDIFCDHLLVIDHGDQGKPRVVGTYRLLRELVAKQHRGFYSSGEYDLSPLLSKTFQHRLGEGRQLLELGRSCVHQDYRNLATINLLWRGIATYLATHNIGFIFGCASLHGVDPNDHAVALSYLHHHHLADESIRVRTLPEHYVPMERLPRGSYDVKEAVRSLPPLIKGYLRVGCVIGDGGFVDDQFNTVDVFILLPVEQITARYNDRYKVGANDPA